MAVLMASVIMQVGHKAAGGWRQVAGTRNRSRPSRNPRVEGQGNDRESTKSKSTDEYRRDEDEGRGAMSRET